MTAPSHTHGDPQLSGASLAELSALSDELDERTLGVLRAHRQVFALTGSYGLDTMLEVCALTGEDISFVEDTLAGARALALG